MTNLLRNLISILMLFPCVPAWAQTVDAVVPVSTSVGQFEKFEARIEITAAYDPADKYRYRKINVYAIFTSPTGVVERKDGFWMDRFSAVHVFYDFLDSLPDPGFFLRYAPKETGLYSYTVYVKDSTGKTSQGLSGSFTSVPSDNKGYIETNNTHYLSYSSDKSAFIPIGINIAWPFAFNLHYYQSWMDSMAANNMNYGRIFNSVLGYGIESKCGAVYYYAIFKGLEDYEQHRAFYYDSILNMAKARGIKISTTEILHNELMVGDGQGWNDNPYNRINGGMCDSVMDFFTKDSAITVFENRLQYISARWGYSTNIMLRSLLNEMSNVTGFDSPMGRTKIRGWFDRVATTLRSFDPNVLISADYGYFKYTFQDDTLVDPLFFQNPKAQVTFWHRYSNEQHSERTLKRLYDWWAETYSKPTLQGERGDDIVEDGYTHPESMIRDPRGVDIHNEEWATAFSAGIGPSASWYWQNRITQQSLWHHWKYISSAVNYFDRVHGDFKPCKASSSGGNKFGTVKVVPAGSGWGYAPGDSVFYVNYDGSITPAATELHQVIYGSIFTGNEWASAKYFNVNYPIGGTFVVDVQTFDRANVTIYVDGNLVNNSAADYDRQYSVNIRAGNHVIKLTNSGEGWFLYRSVTFTNISSPLDLYSLSSADSSMAQGFILNNDYNSKYYTDSAAYPSPVIGATLNIPVSDGTYFVSFYDTHTNAVLSSAFALATQNTGLSVLMPPIVWGVYYTAEPISRQKNPGQFAGIRR
jgi:hypothetical protein